MNTNINLFVILIGFNIISTITTQRIYICGKDDVWITSTSKHFKIQNNNTISFHLEIIVNKNASWKNTTTKKNDLHFKYKEGTRYQIKCFDNSNNKLLSESYVNSPIDLSYVLKSIENKLFLNIFGFKHEIQIKSIKMCMSDSIYIKDLCDEVNENWKNNNFKNDSKHSQPFTESVTFDSLKLINPSEFITINSINLIPIITEPSSHTLIGLLQTQEGHQFYINFNNALYIQYNTIQYDCLITETTATKKSSTLTLSTAVNTLKESLTSSVSILSTTLDPTEKTSNLKEYSTDKLNDNLLFTGTIASSSFIVIALLLTSSFFLYRLIKKRKTRKTDLEETILLNNTTMLNNIENNTITVDNIEDKLSTEHANIPTAFGISITTLKKAATGNNLNALPYKFNRIKLEGENYINASYIPDYNGINKYIATQHPQVSTKDNFLKMIEQENVSVIVMLTGQDQNMELEDAYSSVNQIVELYGTLLNLQDYIDFNVKEYEYKHSNQCRKIIQIQYTQWEENGIPNSPHNYVNFIKFFRSQKYKSPIVIHCSTGVDKTRDFILYNYLLDLHDNNQELDYIAAVIHLRKHRLGMINQTLQYKFCHYVVKEALKTSRKITIENFTSKTYNDADLTNDLEYINNDPIDLIYTKQKHPFFIENKHKNRNKKTVLGCKGFLYLHPKNDYINANKIYHCGKSYICTQQPLKEAVGDFWRLIDQEETQLILVLQEVTDTNFWPDKNHLQLTNYLQISPNNYQFGDHYDEIKLKLSKTKINKVINLMYLKSWKQNSFPKLEIFINFILQSINNDYTKITIVCSDGSEACGIYLSFLKVLEQIKLEQAVDFCRAISMLRMYRSDFVNNLEQLQFLYDVTKAYLNNDHEYATID